MKRTLLLLALLALPLVAGAEEGTAVMVSDGTLYTVHLERSVDHPSVPASSDSYLVLTSRRGETVAPEIIPATLHGGAHFNPVIAYDGATRMLFAFWIHNPDRRETELMFASRNADGVWSQPSAFGNYVDRRQNLRIAVTRKYEDEKGEIQNGLTVHLSWWQVNLTTQAKSARYMMVTIADGNVAGMESLDLQQFVTNDRLQGADEEAIDLGVLMQPLMVASPAHDSVLLLFGDLETRTLNSVRVRPVTKVGANGRLRVPGGRREGGYQAPKIALTDGDRIDAIVGSDGAMALYTTTEGALRYSLLRGEKWSQQHTIALDKQVSAPAAVDALRRLIAEN